MLDNTITLPVDTLNNGTTTNLSYTRYDEYLNRTGYISENHQPGERDTLTFYRTLAKSVGTFKGTRKTTAKFTRDFEVATTDGGAIQAPAIVELNFSVPIGVSTADIVKIRQTAVALLDDDTLMDQLNVLQVI